MDNDLATNYSIRKWFRFARAGLREDAAKRNWKSYLLMGLLWTTWGTQEFYIAYTTDKPGRIPVGFLLIAAGAIHLIKAFLRLQRHTPNKS